MVIMVMVVDFHLGGCRSLKEKRHRMTRIRDRFGKQSNLAVCESDYQDIHHLAQWSFIGAGVDRKKIQQTLAQIELYLDTALDAQITNIDFQEL